jgi:hypothetical protein
MPLVPYGQMILLKNFTQTYSSYKGRRGRVGARIFFLREKGVRLGLVVEGGGQAPGTCVVEICLRLHIPDSTGVSSETGEKQVLLKCVCPRSVFVSLNLFWGNVTPTVPGFRARQARNKRY